MKKQLVTKEMYVDKCKICKQEITGHTEPVVNSRMRMHMIIHREKEKSK